MLKKLLIVIAVCCATAFAEDNVVNPSVDKTSTEKPTPTSTIISTTSSPTKPTNGTTPKPPTTPRPSTTSPVPTTEEPSTTIAPPTKSQYDIKQDNKTCLLVDFALQISLMMDNTTMDFDVPNNTFTDGSSCVNDTDNLLLSWEYEANKTVKLTFTFTMNGTSKKYMLSSTNLMLPYQSKNLSLTSTEEYFPTSLTKSYRCEKQQEIKLSDSTTNTTFAILKLSQLQFQAFSFAKDGNFDAAEDCSSSSSPDIVPIAVGCALVLLIVVVLIAYLLGRRRSQARGYLSM